MSRVFKTENEIREAIKNGESLNNAVFDGLNLKHFGGFCGIDLRGASFKKCVLTGVNFDCANLANADFTGAWVRDATFTNAITEGSTLEYTTMTRDEEYALRTALIRADVRRNYKKLLERRG